ncbi:MAG: cell division protein FtsW [Chloroflexi bacterium]|nr:cell division protein FtsW [Chloroflexota bacterium]
MTIQSQTRNDWTSALRVDYVLLSVVVMLVIIGLIMVFSVTFAPRVQQGFANPQGDFVKQATFAVLGLIALIVCARIDYRWWGRGALILMGITLVLLVVVLFTPPVNYARRWLFDGSIQPAEFAKFAMVVYMAKWLSSKGEKLRQVTYGVLPFAIIVGIVCGLIVLQPNMSTAIIIALCALAMFFIAGADLVQLLLLGIIGGVVAAIVVFKTPYMFDRLWTFVQNPLMLNDREGYQIVQTLIALASGGLLGRGIGAGYGKFGFVPTPQTDSIFALLGEEMGLVGTWFVLGLFLLLVYRGFRIAANARDPFGQVLAAGLTFWMIFQAFVNIGVVTATIPFTGVPLPFISFGGSSLLIALVSIGVLLSISRAAATKEPNATFNLGWRNGGTRVPRADRRQRNSAARR